MRWPLAAAGGHPALLWDAGRNHVLGIEFGRFFTTERKVNSLPKVFKGAGRWLGPWGTQSRGSFWPLRKLPGP